MNWSLFNAPSVLIFLAAIFFGVTKGRAWSTKRNVVHVTLSAVCFFVAAYVTNLFPVVRSGATVRMGPPSDWQLYVIIGGRLVAVVCALWFIGAISACVAAASHKKAGNSPNPANRGNGNQD